MMMTCMTMVLAACVATQEADPAVPAEDWLTRIEAKAADVRSLSAKITYTREQALLGDRQHRYGTLDYEAGPPAKFVARFDKLAVDGALHAMDKTYVFDGRYLVERDEDERIWSRWELAREGEAADLLALGEGPFALPLNMKKDAVLARFHVTPGSEDDGGKLVHLILTPKVPMDVTRVDLWFDAATLLPTRARQTEENGNATDVKLRELVVNPENIEDHDRYNTSPPEASKAPEAANWQVNDHPLPAEDTAKTPAATE